MGVEVPASLQLDSAAGVDGINKIMDMFLPPGGWSGRLIVTRKGNPCLCLGCLVKGFSRAQMGFVVVPFAFRCRAQNAEGGRCGRAFCCPMWQISVDYIFNLFQGRTQPPINLCVRASGAGQANVCFQDASGTTVDTAACEK